MAKRRLQVLCLSYLFPTPGRPEFGVFVERQMSQLSDCCDITVVSPVRIFPRLRIFKALLRPRELVRQFGQWLHEIRSIPRAWQINGLRSLYPRYTSPPRQICDGLSGFFAYPRSEERRVG